MNLEEKLKKQQYKEIWQQYCGFLDLSMDGYMKIQRRLMEEQIRLWSNCGLGQSILKGKHPTNLDEFRKMVPLTTYEDYADVLLTKQPDMLPGNPVIWIQTTWEGGKHPIKVAPYTRSMLDTYRNNVTACLILSTSKEKGSFDVAATDKFLYALAPLPFATGLFPLALGEEIGIEFLPAVDEAVNMLNAGAVLGVKGIGGYQFVCTPESAYAVLKLREIKMRNRKPFAVMFPSIDRLRDFASVSPAERDLLLSPARPIVLLSAGRSHFERYVSGESMYLGAFLPNTGLHKILTDSCGPLIVTSGNISDEPMSFRDEDYFRHEFNAVEGVLYNKRRILTPMDDSVTRVINNKPQMIRRARGYVPIPVITEYEAPKNVLAVGGDLKAAFAISRGHRIILSQYFGDMESYEVMTNYKEAVSRMEKLYSFTPAVIVADKHPLYNSTMYARSYAEKNGIKIVTVQHHHAHIASVMAEYSLNHCIGVAFDGTGYGTDGTVWGGEFLRCRGAKYERMSHIEPVVLAGGDSAARDAKQTAECIKIAAGIESTNETLKAAIENNIGTYISTSIGRVFDAVAALLGIKTENTYEGECAIALENAAASTKTSYDMPAMDDPKEIITEVIKAAGDRVDVREIARGFHDSLVKLIVGKCMIIRDSTAERNVALSGGVFANRLLLEKTIDALEKQGFNVYINRQVPMNDQGIALGQAYLLNL